MLAVRLLSPLLAGSLLLTGCGDGSAGESAAGGSGEDLDVVASFYPLQYLTQRLVGDRADVTALTSPGQEPHDLELSVSQTGRIAGADLVVHLGNFQPSVDDAVEQNAPEAGLDVAEAADLVSRGDHADEHAGEHEGEHEEEHEGDDAGDHGGVDPHFWQDPARMSAVAEAVAARLAEVDPAHAEEYDAHLRALRRDLAALDAAYAGGLADCARTTVVVSHDAFAYLEKYGLDLVPIAGLSPGAEPSPASLAELAALVEREDVTTVFSETLTSADLAETLAEEAGVETGVLDPVEGLTDETGDEDYLSLMRANLDALRAAGGCAGG